MKAIGLCVVALLSAAALQGQSPRIDSITPSQAPIAGGTAISIRGVNFTNATITIDKAAVSLSSIAADEIHFNAPKHGNGIVTVQVATAAGIAYGELLYLPPKLGDLPPGYITTVAGVGLFTGLYRQATQAEINPQGSPTFDQNGNLYIPEPGNERVSRVRPDGVLEPFAGSGLPVFDQNGDGGPATDARVNFPRGVTTDSAGNAYITENGSGRIRRVDKAGIITTVAGNGTRGFSGDGGPALRAQLNSTTHITGDGKGTIFFIDFDNVIADGRIRKVTPDGIINTVAGNGQPGFSGDGGPATQAQLNFRFDDSGSLALDPQGNLYIADSANYRIRRIDGASGIITTFFTLPSTGPMPQAVATDSQGNVYFEAGSRIQKMSPSGEMLAAYGSGSNRGFSEDGTPIAKVDLHDIGGLAIDPAGNMVYVDQILGRVRRLNLATGVVETLAGMFPRIVGDNGPALGTLFASGNGDVAVLPNGELLVGDGGHLLVRKIDVNGNISTFSKGKPYSLFDGSLFGFNAPVALRPDGAGNIFMADVFNIYRLDSSGHAQLFVGRIYACGYSGDGGPAANAEVCQPWDAVRDAAGNLFIADTNNNRVRRVDARTGVITTSAGSGPVNGAEHYGQGTFCGDGGPARQACLNTPYGVAFDADGNLLISDSTARIRKVDRDGNIRTLAKLPFVPTKLAVDGAGNVYTVLRTHIVRCDPFGTVTVVAGDPSTQGFAGDGGPASQARIAADGQSIGIAIDGDGNIFFIDSNNFRLRAIRFGAVLAPTGARAQTRGGTPQSTAIGTRFPDGLAVLVSDALGNPAGNVRVDFDAPSGGASCVFSNQQTHIGVLTDRNGLASAVCTANTVTGAFTVTAVPLGTALSLKFALTITAPQLVSNSIVNGASFLNGPVAPGEIVTIFGAGVGPLQLVPAAPVGGRFGTELAGVRVRFNGTEAPVLFARFDQVAVVVPYALDGATSAQVVVEYAGVASNAIAVPVAQASPGIFSGDSSGRGQGAILNQDNSVNSAANPADRGSIVVLFCTGEGQTDPPGVDGKLASDVYPKPKLPVSVMIGGLAAEVVYYGAAPTLVAGVMQVNARVPATATPGSGVSVVLTVGQAASRPDVTVAIR